MTASTQTRSDSTDSVTIAAHVHTLADTYATLHGFECPLTTTQGSLHDGECFDPTVLFPSPFFVAHTEYDNWDEFAAAAPWDIEDRAALAAVPKAKFTRFVAQSTEFGSTASFFAAATETLLDQEDGE